MLDLAISGLIYFLVGYFLGKRELPYKEQIEQKLKEIKRPKAQIKEAPTPEQLNQTDEEREYDRVVGDKIKKMIKL